MKTITLTIATLAVAALLSPGAVRADQSAATINGVEIAIAHQGPGAGSVKSVPFAWIAEAPKASKAMAFHATEPLVATVHQGPGLGSVKSPAVR